MLGAVLQAAAGGPLPPSARAALGLPGELFMRALRCAVVPLVAGSTFSGVLSLQARGNTRFPLPRVLRPPPRLRSGPRPPPGGR